MDPFDPAALLAAVLNDIVAVVARRTLLQPHRPVAVNARYQREKRTTVVIHRNPFLNDASLRQWIASSPGKAHDRSGSGLRVPSGEWRTEAMVPQRLDRSAESKMTAAPTPQALGGLGTFSGARPGSVARQTDQFSLGVPEGRASTRCRQRPSIDRSTPPIPPAWPSDGRRLRCSRGRD